MSERWDEVAAIGSPSLTTSFAPPFLPKTTCPALGHVSYQPLIDIDIDIDNDEGEGEEEDEGNDYKTKKSETRA